MNIELSQEAWRADARCLGVDPELFFPSGGTHIGEEAREICGVCPVRKECLSFALEHREQHGVWGGLSIRERRRIVEHKKLGCGTEAGYARHKRNNEDPCHDCLEATRAARRLREKKRGPRFRKRVAA